MKIRSLIVFCILVFITNINSVTVFSIASTGILTIKSSNPINNQLNVKTDKIITITFNSIVKKTITFNKIMLSDKVGKPVKFTSYLKKNVVEIRPASKLKLATSYILDIPAGTVTDIYGKLKNKEYKLEFKTQESVVNNKGKTKFEVFEFGKTFDECKKKLKSYKIINGKEMIKVENYMNINGKNVTLILGFSNGLVFDKKNMKELNDFRLTYYTFGIEGIDYNYDKKLVEEFCKLYGKPKSNDFFEKDSGNKDYRYAIWRLENFDISISDYTGEKNNGKSFIYISFKINDKERERFKQYIK